MKNNYVDTPALEAFLKEPAPRRVSLNILDMVRSERRGLNWPKVRRGFLVVFFLVGVLPMAAFFPWAYSAEYLATSAKSVKTTGKIVAYEETSATEDHQRRRPGSGKRVYRLGLEFIAANGRTIRAESYVTGAASVPGLSSGAYDSAGLAIRDIPAEISYFAAFPRWAVYRYGRMTLFAPNGAFSILFPLFFCLPIFFTGKERRELSGFLSQGLPAEGVITDFVFEPRGNGHAQRGRFSLSYQTPQELRTAVYYAYAREIEEMTRRWESKQTVRLLYLPQAPGQILPLWFLTASRARTEL